MKFIRRLSLLHWLLLATFCKGLIFSLLIPLWQSPDEQAHFAQVQYIAELGRAIPPDYSGNTLSQEIHLSQQLLGVDRDELGKNRFTHHPEFRLDYTDSTLGKYETVIKKIPPAARTAFVKVEATRYPPLYYYVGAVFYRLVYPLNLIDRVYFTRLASIFMGLVTVYFSFRLAALVFGARSPAAFTVALLVSFQPMFSFLTAGVNSDNLMNLLFTVFLYYCARIISCEHFQRRTRLGLVAVLVALILTKPHWPIALAILVSVPFFLPLRFIRFVTQHKPQMLLLLVLTVILLGVRLLLGRGLPGPDVNLISALSQPRFPQVSLVGHFAWTLDHTIAEVIPWYWGVFKWLGVTLPRPVNRLLNRLLIFSALGLLIWTIKAIRSPTAVNRRLTVFLASSSLIYFFSLFYWDWLFRRHHAFSFGMQGRYYFPTLSAHMILGLLGLITLVPERLRVLGQKLIGLGVLVLNFTGVFTIINSYYDLFPLTRFFLQLSQYKPLYFKTPWLGLWLVLYLISLVGLVVSYLTYKPERYGLDSPRRFPSGR